MARRSMTSPDGAPVASDGTDIVTAADFGRALRRRRKQLGHAQAEAAALCRVGTRFLSDLERGKPTAQIGKALKVAFRLGLQLRVTPRSAPQRPTDRR